MRSLRCAGWDGHRPAGEVADSIAECMVSPTDSPFSLRHDEADRGFAFREFAY